MSNDTSTWNRYAYDMLFLQSYIKNAKGLHHRDTVFFKVDFAQEGKFN